MTIHRLTRRTMLEGAAALGAIGCLPTDLAAQSGRAEPLPGRGDIVIRGANVLTMDERSAIFASGDVHIRDGAIVAVGADVNVPGARGDRRPRHDLHAGLRRYPLAPLDQHAAAVRPLRCRRAERIPGLHPPRPAHDAAGRLCQRRARHRRGAERRRHHGAQLGAQHPQPRARRRRAFRHARRRHSRPLRLRPGAGHAGRPADGSRRPRPRQAATWMPGDGMLTLGICSRNVGGGSIGGGARGSPSTDMAKKDWDGARALGLPITLAHLRPEPDHDARGGRPARPRRAARAPAADHAGGARDPQDARGELFDRAGAGVAPLVQPRRRPARRTARGRRQGEPVDRPYLELQMRSVRRDARAVRAASAPAAQQAAGHAQAPRAARHARRRDRPRASPTRPAR